MAPGQTENPQTFDPACLERIPALPGVVQDLMRSFDDQEIGASEIAEQISHEPGISLRVLKIVNSSFYGLPRQIGSLPEAVMVLGFSTVRSLVIGASVVAHLPTAPDGAFDPLGIWRHSFKCALIARRLAKRARVDPEWAFTAGLFHDAGKLVMYPSLPGLYARVLERCREQNIYAHMAERDLAGMDHGEVGARLMAHWKLPVPIEQAVACHHVPEAADGNRLGELVHLADILSHAVGTRILPPLDELPATAERPVRRLGLTPSDLDIDTASFNSELASLQSLIGDTSCR